MNDGYRRLWSARGPIYRTLSALLSPAELAYRTAVATRTWMYDRGLLRSARAPIPTLAVGNLTVGGTGKTPVTAWFAGTLAAANRRPAVVMRGYGGDEVQVHRLLNPSVRVHVAADRVAGVRRAQGEGAEIALLDDAFQHRALQADACVVLVATEDWTASPRLLPRGPWREPLAALRRATLIVTTRKLASGAEAARVAKQLAELHPSIPQAVAYIGLAGLARYDEVSGRLDAAPAPQELRCPLALAGVARPEAVFAQLEEAGVTVDERRAFPDHHRYTRDEVAWISQRAAHGPLVATLKDAVKLGGRLEPGTEIYVPLQRVEWESGRAAVDRLLSDLGERRA